jgi:anaerobic selenocysteine-containing dehydrogenase
VCSSDLQSDIVLPVAYFFEESDISIAGDPHFLPYSEKAIEPPFEAKSDADIIRLLSAAMGFGEHFEITDDEYHTAILDNDGSKALGISFDSIKKGPINFIPTPDGSPHIAWADYKFATPSGRVEFYSEKPVPRLIQGFELDYARERLPRFIPPEEAWPENPLFEKYPFVLLSERTLFRVHSQFFDVPLLRELDPEPVVKLNPSDAATKGIKDGAYVEVFNDRGTAVAKAMVINNVRPGVLLYPKGWQRHQHKAGGWSELTSSSLDPFAVNQNFMDNLADIRLWEGAE